MAPMVAQRPPAPEVHGLGLCSSAVILVILEFRLGGKSRHSWPYDSRQRVTVASRETMGRHSC